MLTGSSDFFTGLRDNATELVLDYARAKYVDVEREEDDKNIPDSADMRNGFLSDDGLQVAPGGITLTGWLMIGAVVVAGVLLVKRVL